MRIAIWTYKAWAFGQIFSAIKKYSKHQIDIYDWGKIYEKGFFDSYDLIHVPVVQAYETFLRNHPYLKNKTCCSTHGKAELFNYNPETNIRHNITPQEVDSNIIPKEMASSINSANSMCCVSRELVKMLESQTTSKIFYTPCGVDEEVFRGEIIEHKKLVVLCPMLREDAGKSEHQYNVKRWDLALELEKKLPNIEFLFLDRRVPINEMPKYYRKGDIILCLSHSEGNPLGIIEAGAMGVLPVTTIVGDIPNIVVDNVNGMTLDNDSPLESAIVVLEYLDKNRKHLLEMRKNIQKDILEKRTWKKLINSWDEYFSSFGSQKSIRKGGIVMQDKKKFRFHILGLVHLPCSKNYMSCAFTQKNYKLAKMLLSLGHEVYYLGAEGSNVPCTKFIQTHTLSDIRKEWGDGDNRFEIGYNWKETDFRHDFNIKKTETTLKFYKNCIDEINKIKKDDDFLLVTQGTYHKPIADAVKLYLTCEPGIGYRGSYCNFRAFESSYIQNFTYGSQHPFECINGSYYDRVIPNYFDEEDFEFSDEKENYYLYIGRIIKRKGIQTAYLTTQAIGTKLIIVGQGGRINPDGSLSGDAFTIPKGNWEYLGFADVVKRKKLMSKAIATFVATEYLECFGGTHIESMLSGTPPITTNFGVFTGTIPDCVDGKVGFRCNTLDDFCKASLKAKEFKKEDYLAIRKYGERFLSNVVKNEYEKWFSDLYRVYLSATVPGEKGWSWIDKK